MGSGEGYHLLAGDKKVIGGWLLVVGGWVVSS